ncbi:hypothetical protein LIER_38618 [Lithospermum erythrorhizon]|uniref:Uncharacterized protein n=1 Tax=Lithospermum erythrorhizon TaxID=34254 RepID=A0AAV3Q3L6_LITER
MLVDIGSSVDILYGTSITGSSKDEIPNPGGIGEVCGDQKKAIRCYQTFVPPLNKRPCEQERKQGKESHMEIHAVKSEVDEDDSPKERGCEKKIMPHEEVIIVPFIQGNKERTFKIGSKLGK